MCIHQREWISVEYLGKNEGRFLFMWWLHIDSEYRVSTGALTSSTALIKKKNQDIDYIHFDVVNELVFMEPVAN